MPAVTLLAKAYIDSQQKQAERLLKAKLEGLKAELKTSGTTSRGWIQIDLSGEDEKAALHYLNREIGLCPASLVNIERFSTIRGRIVSLDKCKNDACLDIGVFEPETVDATIPLSVLQAQLGDGRKIALRKLVELFGFCDNLPLTVGISSLDRERDRLEVVLAETQLSKFRSWTDSLLDRLVVLGASVSEVRSAIEGTGFQRDVVEVEALGLFEHAIVCKLGTDAAGLIPRLGRCLPYAVFSVFSPRRVLEFFDEDSHLFALS
jgi:hypothetical protein